MSDSDAPGRLLFSWICMIIMIGVALFAVQTDVPCVVADESGT